jgi:hypothetical protein
MTLSIYAQVMDHAPGELERLQALVDGGSAPVVSARSGTSRGVEAIEREAQGVR